MEVISHFRYETPPHLDLTKAHKRTASEPSQGVNSLSQQYSFTPHFDFQPTTPVFQSGQQALNGIMESPHTSPCATTESPTQDNALFRCMYCADCSTGSTLRKVVSHIFGRNKLCTRMIPDHIWVHFCRKHYQRSRYRNAPEYTVLQCQLVSTQIERVQRWSDDNKKNGRVGVVKDWTLSMRKREQNRIHDRAKKRMHSDMCDEEDNNDNPAEDDDNNPNHPDLAKRDSNPVPDWLRHMCREGYGTEEIIRLVNRIKNDLTDGRLQQIPDIEILPNIPTTGAQAVKAMILCGRRKPPHKRSQSLGVTGQGRHPSSMVQQRDSVLCRPSTSSPSFPSADKRQRTLGTVPYHEHSSFVSSRHLPYGIPFPREPLIQESHAEEPYYDGQAVGESHYTYNRCMLPSPEPSRSADAPMPTLLEPNAPGPSRLSHQRSVSEYVNRQSTMGSGFQVARSYPLAPCAPVFTEIPDLHLAPSPNISFETNRNSHMPTNPRFPDTRYRLHPNASFPPSSYLQQPVDRSRHSRHQSTPNANPSVFSHFEAHPSGQINAPGNVYGVPGGLATSSTPNIPIRRSLR
ncbi:hypothetical protein E0Z10_g43 [Xylaria hypoxylon]|uniref:ORP1 like protein n=1 Tax=Xylaria hypoxylon TaxID=37992 RepID=A0A4Z0YXS2_9PEZI|nr:hypothetical protein E0Z10_g43 [Xylaria hypoxylon]